MQSEIDGLFVRRHERNRQQAIEAEERRAREKRFSTDLLKIRAEVIKPTLEDFVDCVKSKKLDARIEERESTDESEGPPKPASVSIVFIEAEGSRDAMLHGYPNVSFDASPSEMRVDVFENTMSGGSGRTGSAGFLNDQRRLPPSGPRTGGRRCRSAAGSRPHDCERYAFLPGRQILGALSPAFRLD